MPEDSNVVASLGGFGLGVSAALLLVLLGRSWSQRFLAGARPRTRSYAFLALSALAGASTALPALSTRELVALSDAPAKVAAKSWTAATGSQSKPAAGPMETATAALSARLASGGGTDADWELLAQSYDFLGRTADAALAREHEVSAGRSLEDAIAVSAGLLGRRGTSVAADAPSVTDGVAELLARAEQLRRERKFAQACDVYAAVVARGDMTADSWADYADAQASLSGTLAGEPARAIAAALALDPRHAKALWLEASLAHEERRYADALRTWKQLLAIVPPGSSDARIVEANIAEASRLASS